MIAKIKSRINCVQYAQRNGLSINKSGDRCRSPLRADAKNKSSFVVRDDFFYDFGSSEGGDVIDFCALMAHHGDRGAAIRELARTTGVTEEESPDWLHATTQLNNLIQRWHENLTDADREYLHSRRITDETIARCKIGSTGRGEYDGFARNRISIPYIKNGYVYSYVARGDNPKYLKRRNDSISDASAPWGMETLNRKDKPLIIAEGTFDALSFMQEGYPVLATMGGNFANTQLKTVFGAMHNYPSTILAFDNDSPGREFMLTLGQKLLFKRIPFKTVTVPAPHKDISDYYAAGGDLAELIALAKPGVTQVAIATTSKDDFRELAYEASLYMDSADLAMLFDATREANIFPAPWLMALQKQCERPPSEDVIAKKVVHKHTLRYLDNIGFYEYDGTVWNRTDDIQIQSYIGHELGRYRTGSRLSSILKIVKTDALTDQPFDRKPLFNFVNGTLELSDPPVFREHSPDDLCSIKAKYPYDPKADSPAWRQFIKDVAADDPKREQLLQEIAGYILYPTCELERMFVLQGSGGNGKSVYLNLLQQVYGEENGSSVSTTGICADFQRIYLSTSLYNIATEVKSDLSGSEEYLKQAISGETMSACYKGKDFVQFKPRCKLIFATNGSLRSSDTSDGLLRRLSIVNFNQTFVPHPSKEGEKKKDTGLTEKLKQDLPAIFNWCLQGYLMLMRTKEFTTMEDEETAKTDFKEASNPIIIFLREEEIVQPGGAIHKKQLFSRWKRWAEDNGHQPGSSTRLYREVKKLFPDGTIEADTTRNGEKFKGFIFPNNNPAFEVEQFEQTRVNY